MLTDTDIGYQALSLGSGKLGLCPADECCVMKTIEDASILTAVLVRSRHSYGSTFDKRFDANCKL